MDDPKTIIYVVLLVVFAIIRLIGQAKKKQQNQELPAPPAQRPIQPPTAEKEKSLLETIREEIEKQKELNKPKPEIKQKTFSAKQVVKAPPKKFLERQVAEGSSDYATKAESVTSVFGKMKRVIVLEEPEQERKFDFDPREAFMMKTLLERPYS